MRAETRTLTPLAPAQTFTRPGLARRAPSLPKGDLGLARVARVSVDPNGGALPVSLVRLEGAAAPMLIPGAVTPLTPNPFKTYARKLAKACAFPDQVEEIARLGAHPSRVEPLRSDRPWVALMVSEPSSLLPGEFKTLERLAETVRKLGCEPILIPPMLDLVLVQDLKARRAGISSLASRFHGIIGPGGADVHPRIYKERITHAVNPVYPRDRFEADFVTSAMKGHTFLLGVCRSHQLWNAATGGKLVQDVQREGLSSISQDQDEFGLPRSEPFVVRDESGAVVFENRVHFTESSELARLVGAPSVLTNSLHHQAVERPGASLEVTGLVPDPVTERPTIEATESWNVITTQFHPELMMHDDRFRRLVETVARRAHVFFHAEGMKSSGETGVKRLADRVRGAAGELLSELDRRWLEAEVAPRLQLA